MEMNKGPPPLPTGRSYTLLPRQTNPLLTQALYFVITIFYFKATGKWEFKIE